MTSLYNRGLFHAAVSSPDYTVSNTVKQHVMQRTGLHFGGPRLIY